MTRNALVNDLIRYCWMVALAIAAFAFIFIRLFSSVNTSSVLYSAFVGVRIFIQGMANIMLMLIIHKRLPRATTRRKKLIRYFIGYAFAFLFFLSTDPLEEYLTLARTDTWVLWQRLSPMSLQAFINNTIVIVVQNFIILRHEKATADRENSELRIANIESANLLLKQQIHPHFLFNALSMLKSLYKTDVEAGEAYLSHLVNFLRASLAEPQAKTVSVRDEIKLCHDYLEMQKIRFENALICTIDIPEQVLQHGSVPSFSLQSLIENAIKHNEVTESSPLVIAILYRNGYIRVKNNLQARTYVDTPSGKGLINLIERYKILSSDEVIISQDTKTFSVSIKVLGNETSDHRR